MDNDLKDEFNEEIQHSSRASLLVSEETKPGSSSEVPGETRLQFRIPKTFKKRAGTTDRGKDYEHLFITQCVLKLILNENVEDFYMSSNDESYGSFDDVVIHVKHSNETEYRTIAFQLKHKQQHKLTINALTAKNGDFSVRKYYNSTCEEKNKPSGESALKVLFTNCPIFFKQGEKILFDFGRGPFEVNISEVNDDPLLNILCNEPSYTFISTTQCKEFLGNFVISTKQASLTKMEKDIKTILNDTFGHGADEKGFDEFYKFICKWSLSTKEKHKLNKTWMRRVLAMSILSPYVKPIFFDTVQISARAKILQSLLTQDSITFVEKKNYHILKTLWKNVIYEVDIEDAKILKNKYHIDIDFISQSEDLCRESVNVSKLLWLLEKCPLVVEESEVTKKVIEFHTNGRFVILTDNGPVSTESQTIFKNQQILQNLKHLKTNQQLFQKVLENFTYSLECQKESSLKSLLEVCPDMENSIRINDLIEMVDAPLIVGKKNELALPHYIPRFLRKDLIDSGWLNEKNKKCVVAVDYVENLSLFKSKFGNENEIIEFEKNIDLQLQTEDDRNMIYVKRTKYSTEDFEQLCSKYATKEIHLFRYVNENLDWILSSNNTTFFENIRTNSQITGQKIPEQQLLHYYNNKTIVVCANPGMGKSFLMMNLKNNSSSECWAILIKARSVGLYLQKSNQNVDKFLEYLLDTAYSDHNTKAVFKCYLESNRFQIIWDGCDETTDENMELILKMMKILSEKGIKQLLTSRKHLKDKIENRLTTIAFDLETFDENEQREYVTQRVEVPSEEKNNIFEKIKNNIALSSNNDILGIPLQIYMLTELLLGNKNKYLELLDDVFKLSDLYGHFIERKFEVYYSDKLETNLQIDTMQETFENDKKCKYIYYKQAAMKLYFFQNKITEIFRFFFQNGSDEYLLKIGGSRDYLKFKDNLGLIVKVSEDNIPEFAHNSYGEYFAALYLSENSKFTFRNRKCISQRELSNIRFFLDLILADKSKAHVAVLHKNCSLLQKCTDPELVNEDKAGRSVLEVSCKWTPDYPSIINLNDHIPIKTYPCVPYQKIANTYNSINSKNDSYLKNLFILMPFLIPTYEKDNWYVTALIYTIKFDYDICLNYFESQHYFLELDKHKLKIVLDRTIKFRAIKCLNKFVEMEMFSNILLKKIGKSVMVCHPIFNETFTVLIHKGLAVNELFNYCCRYSGEQQCNYLSTKIQRTDIADEEGNLPIHSACMNRKDDSFNIVELLLSKGAPIDTADANGNLPILLACKNEGDNSFEIVKLLLSKGAPIDTADANGNLPIHLACKNEGDNSFEIVKLLLSKGAPIDTADENGKLPIHFACKNINHNSFKIVELLLSKGAPIDTADVNGNLPIHLACRDMGFRRFFINIKSIFKTVELLLSKGSPINTADANGNLPIHLACKNETEHFFEIVILLLSKGAQIDTADANGNLPILLACKNEGDNSFEIVKLLLSKGAPIDTADPNGNLPIHLACKNEGDNSFEIVKLLLSKGAPIDTADENGNLPIHLACKNESDNSIEIIKLLISKGAPIDTADANEKLPIHLACKNKSANSIEIVKLLLSKGAPIDTADANENLPIHLACKNESANSIEIVKLLLSKGAPIDTADANENLPIHLACKNKSHNSFEIVKLLLSKGAPIDTVDANGNLPIHLASKNESHNSFEIVKLLLSKCAPIDTADANGNLPIHLACKNVSYNSFKIVKLLLSKGAPIDTADANGNSPIHFACKNEGNNSFEIVKLLLSKGAPIDTADANGNLPIHLACRNEGSWSFEIAELLLSKGATIHTTDANGNLPIHLVCRNKGIWSFEVAELLLSKGATIDTTDAYGNLPIQLAAVNKGMCSSGMVRLLKLQLLAQN